jgi:hypothetical protein
MNLTPRKVMEATNVVTAFPAFIHEGITASEKKKARAVPLPLQRLRFYETFIH